MTERSAILEMGEERFHLRYGRADVKALERELQVSYIYFFNPTVFTSLTALEMFIHRGLHVENRKGQLEHYFELDAEGMEEAGQFVFDRIGEYGNQMRDAVFEAMCVSGLVKRQVGDPRPKEEDSKN
jgi:hypothetical protein